MMWVLLLLQASSAAPLPAPLPATTPAPARTPAPWAVVQRSDGATTTSAWSIDNKARLIVRCDVRAEKIVSIQFIPRAAFIAASPRPVSIKVDDGGWLGTNWQFPGNGAFISEDVIVTNLAVMIAQGHTVRVRAIDPDNMPVDAEFTGPGEAPVRTVLAACHYAYGIVPPRQPAPAGSAAKSAGEDDE